MGLSEMEQELMNQNGIAKTEQKMVNEQALKLRGVRAELVALAEKALAVDRWGCGYDSTSVYYEKKNAINDPIDEVEKRVEEMRGWFKQ